MVKLLLLLSLILVGCAKKISTSGPDELGIKLECKTNEVRTFCKYTNKQGETVCAKTGDGGFTVPCSFYEGI